MPDEKIKLTLDYAESQKDTVDLSGKLDLLKKAADAVGGEFGELVGKSAEAGKSIRSIATEAADTDTNTKASLESIASSAGELFNAFKGGDIKGIATSVGGLVSLVPPLAGFGVAIAAAGSAAAIAWPVLKDWYGWLDKTIKAMPQATQDIKEYAAALREANVELKESAAMEAAKAADKAAKETPSEMAEDRGQRFQDFTKGREADTIKEVTQAVHDAGKADRDEEINLIEEGYDAKVKAALDKGFAKWDDRFKRIEAFAREDADAALKKVGEGEQDKAEKLIAGARAGDAGALKKLQEILPPGSAARDAASMASPEAQAEDRAARREWDAAQERFAEQRKQDQARVATNDQVQARIKADKGAQDAKAIERSENAARGQAVRDAAIAAGKAFGAGGARMQGAGAAGPGAAPAAAAAKLKALQKAATRKAARERQAGKDKAARDAKAAAGAAADRAGYPAQTNAKMISAMEGLAANQAGAAHADGVRIEQLMQVIRDTRTAQQINRSASSNGMMA